MGSINSAVPAIERTQFNPIPPKGWKNAMLSVAVVDGAVFIKTDKGGVYTNSRINRKICWCGTGSDEPAVIALEQLGIITAEERHKHGERHRVVEKAREIASAAIESLDTLEAAGIKLTPTQAKRREEMREITRQNYESCNIPYWMRGMVAKALAIPTPAV